MSTRARARWSQENFYIETGLRPSRLIIEEFGLVLTTACTVPLSRSVPGKEKRSTRGPDGMYESMVLNCAAPTSDAPLYFVLQALQIMHVYLSSFPTQTQGIPFYLCTSIIIQTLSVYVSFLTMGCKLSQNEETRIMALHKSDL